MARQRPLHARLHAVVLALGLVALAAWPSSAAHFAMEDAIWQVKCGWVGRNWDDAIVHPGEPGQAHGHDYFGTRATAFSTVETLAAGTPDCAFGSNSFKPEPDDHAAYWAPLIRHNGQKIDMSRAELDAYYWLGKNHPPVQPFPYGLKIIAGDSHATSPQPVSVVRMKCVDNHGGAGPIQGSIPDCRSGPYNTVAITILFPECWDGVNLDTANGARNPVTDVTYPNDHKSHMAYATADGCPASHPVKVPKLSLLFRYLGDWHGGPTSVFSSGGVYSAHADFWSAWDPDRQAELVDVCLNAVRNCRREDV